MTSQHQQLATKLSISAWNLLHFCYVYNQQQDIVVEKRVDFGHPGWHSAIGFTAKTCCQNSPSRRRIRAALWYCYIIPTICAHTNGSNWHSHDFISVKSLLLLWAAIKSLMINSEIDSKFWLDLNLINLLFMITGKYVRTAGARLTLTRQQKHIWVSWSLTFRDSVGLRLIMIADAL